ncbi:hypothetical protein JG559_09360 [Enterococcus faecalis]|uniref:Uncharacterized protein n=1 Tax=Enterococcus faecalis TaxID=1351 RepID=A0A974NYP1_ENTFL|nr:hypothetical protein JG559_09360 [Enterococcus faecalis]
MLEWKVSATKNYKLLRYFLFRYPKASISPSGYLQVETVPIALIATVDNKLITVSNGPNDIVHGIQKEAFTHQDLSIEKALIFSPFMEDGPFLQ